MWTLPPVKNARACESCSVSMTTPWPAKAASPWIRMGNTRVPVVSPRRSWRARTEPSTTGFTTSRCEGLNASATCTLPPGVRRSDEKPLWYFTSPEPCMCAVSYLPSNSLNSTEGDLPSRLTSTLRRPRWAMPMTHSSTPCSPPRWMRSSSSGISESPPSSEKRFWPTYLVCR